MQLVQKPALLRIRGSVDHAVTCALGVPRRIPDQPAPQRTLSVQRQTEGDSVNPGAKLLRIAQRAKFPISAQERFLGYFLSVCCVSHNTVSNLKDTSLIFTNAYRKVGVGELARLHAGACFHHAGQSLHTPRHRHAVFRSSKAQIHLAAGALDLRLAAWPKGAASEPATFSSAGSVPAFSSGPFDALSQRTNASSFSAELERFRDHPSVVAASRQYVGKETDRSQPQKKGESHIDFAR